MKSSKVLEMLQQNRIDELMAELQDEIFTESLKTKPNVKKRYTAMKRYLKSCSETRPILQKPCEVEFEGSQYNAFCNTYTLAMTKESCGEIAMCDEPDRFPKVTNLVKRDGDEGRIDLNKVMAEAKSKGYKFTKNQIYNNDFLMHYNESYFRIGLVDITYGVIDNGEEAVVYGGSRNRPITVENDIGIAVIMPVRLDGGPEENMVIIEA